MSHTESSQAVHESEGVGRSTSALPEPPDQPVPPGPSDPLVEHIRRGLATRLRTLLHHDPGTRSGEDPEDLHRMRVSVRRMRAMLRAGRKFLDKNRLSRLDGELRWLGRALGPVRDLDVLLLDLHTRLKSLPETDRSAAMPLLDTLDRQRARARAEMLSALDSDRYFELLAMLARDVATPWSGESTDSVAAIRRVLGKRVRDLDKATADLDENAGDAELHALRIKAKRLRYTAELASAVLGEDARGIRQAAEKLQDTLGAHQDARVAEQRVREPLDENPRGFDGATWFAAGRLAEQQTARRERARGDWLSVWSELREEARRVGF